MQGCLIFCSINEQGYLTLVNVVQVQGDNYQLEVLGIVAGKNPIGGGKVLLLALATPREVLVHFIIWATYLMNI